MKLFVVFRNTMSDPPELDSIFLEEENMIHYLDEIESKQDEWESANVTYSTKEYQTQD